MLIIRALIVYNPKSGRWIIENKIEEIYLYLLKDYEVSVFHSSFKKEITSYLFYNAKRFDLIVLLGGDGTLHEAINGLMKSKKRPPILYLPSGTINDFAKGIGVSKNYQKELELLREKPKEIDVCKVDNKYFLYTLGCGKFTNISYDEKMYFLKHFFKRFFYYFKLFKNLFVNHKYKLKIVTKNTRIDGVYFLFLALQIDNVAGFKIRGKKSLLDDGEIHLYFFKYRRFLSILSLMLFYLLKRKNNFFFDSFDSDEIKISSDKILKINLDGEGPIYKSEFTIRVIRKSLSIYTRK